MWRAMYLARSIMFESTVRFYFYYCPFWRQDCDTGQRVHPNHCHLQASPYVLVRSRFSRACDPKNWPAYYWTNPVMKRTSSRGISSVLSHLFGHGSGNFVHSSARCACGRKTVIIWPIDWIDGRNTFTEYMHLSGYEFRSDLHQNVLCCPEYISSAKLVNSSL